MKKLEGMKISSVGRIEPTPWFQMRQGRRNFQIPLHGLWSPPALIIDSQGRLRWLHLLMETRYVEKERRTALVRLASKVVTIPESPLVVEYHDFIVGEPFPNVPEEFINVHYPHGAIMKWTYAELAEREGELLCLYRLAQQEFRESGRVSLPSRFCELYQQLLHPAFRNVLATTAPDFFNALTFKE